MIGGRGKLPQIVAVKMGYGHERPARVLATAFGIKDIVLANDYPGIPRPDFRLWQNGQTWYERISRYKNFPVFGQIAFKIMDELQNIPSFYPRRDLSSPSLQVNQFYGMIRKRHFMRHLINKLAVQGGPLVCTFMTPAFAAEEFNYPDDIFVLCTDTDISRAWAPLNPQKSRIKYLAPSARVAERLKLYGVREKNIFLTGFPLPTEAIGGEDSTILLKDLQRRLCNLDPNGYFLMSNGLAVDAFLGRNYCDVIRSKKSHGPVLAFMVGGAGAQQDIGHALLRSVAPLLKAGKLTLHLIVGTHAAVYRDYVALAKELKLALDDSDGLHILFAKERADYFSRLSSLIGQIDVLWTKPSEMSFYAGLGLPVIMSPPVGSQEDFNRAWLWHIGAGVDQLDPRYAAEWLMDWINSGALARLAWNGYVQAPTHGAYRIVAVVNGTASPVPPLPLLI